MVLFLLIGGVRVLGELRKIPETPNINTYEIKYGVNAIEKDLRGIREELNIASTILEDARKQHLRNNEEYLFRREEYRVMMEEGRSDTEIEERYQEAKSVYEESKARYEAAQGNYDEISERLRRVEGEARGKRELALKDFRNAMRIYELKVLAVRLLFAVPLLVIAVFAFMRARAKKSKYMIHVNAFMAFASLLLFYMILEHIWKAFHVIGVSIVGASITAIALAYLKKQIFSFERISMSRIRQNQCPWCSFPITGEYCRNCGKKAMEECPECKELKTVLMPYCQNCGQPSRTS
ncbi:MAG: hypothetical protein ACE5PM_08695 [Candidatus Hydrothermarchaeales archaeon]